MEPDLFNITRQRVIYTLQVRQRRCKNDDCWALLFYTSCYILNFLYLYCSYHTMHNMCLQVKHMQHVIRSAISIESEVRVWWNMPRLIRTSKITTCSSKVPLQVLKVKFEVYKNNSSLGMWCVSACLLHRHLHSTAMCSSGKWETFWACGKNILLQYVHICP